MSIDPLTQELAAQEQTTQQVASEAEIIPNTEQPVVGDQATVALAEGEPSQIVAALEKDSLAPADLVLPVKTEEKGAIASTEVDLVQVPESSLPKVTSAGFLSYKKASSTFPIYHRRFFFFSDTPIPLARLHAFYDKYKKQTEKTELHHLIALAASSGRGLFFFSKTPESVPSGILECARMIEISADESMADKFHISYNAKQFFSFETGTASREAWISAIAQNKVNSDNEIENLKSSANYQAILLALEAGTAFNQVTVPEGANEVLSDDDNANAPVIVSAQSADKPVERPAATKRNSFLRLLKDKLPHEKTTEECIESADKQDKTSKKDKRKSFFGNKKEAPLPTEVEAAENQSEVPNAKAITELQNQSNASSPIKDKVDGFFSKIFQKRAAEKEEGEPKTTAAVVENISDASRVEQTEVLGDEIQEPAVDTIIEPASVEAEIQTGKAVEDNQIGQTLELSGLRSAVPSPEKSPEGTTKAGLARRLTSMFKIKKAEKSTEEPVPSTEPTSVQPPQLPETAALEHEPAEETVRASQVVPSAETPVQKVVVVGAGVEQSST